ARVPLRLQRPALVHQRRPGPLSEPRGEGPRGGILQGGQRGNVAGSRVAKAERRTPLGDPGPHNDPSVRGPGHALLVARRGQEGVARSRPGRRLIRTTVSDICSQTNRTCIATMMPMMLQACARTCTRDSGRTTWFITRYTSGPYSTPATTGFRR